MKRIDVLRMMFACCVFCVCNTILYPAFQRTLQLMDHETIRASIVSIVGVLADAQGEEVDDYSEDGEFLVESSTALYTVYDGSHTKNKIDAHQCVLMDPYLERSTPPPEFFS